MIALLILLPIMAAALIFFQLLPYGWIPASAGAAVAYAVVISFEAYGLYRR